MLFWRQPLEFYSLAWRFFNHLLVSGNLWRDLRYRSAARSGSVAQRPAAQFGVRNSVSDTELDP